MAGNDRRIRRARSGTPAPSAVQEAQGRENARPEHAGERSRGTPSPRPRELSAANATPAAAATVDVPEGFKAMKKKGEDQELDGGHQLPSGLMHCFPRLQSSLTAFLRGLDAH